MNVFRRLEREETEAILRWTYESPYDLYNHRPADRDMLLREFLEAENFYFALLDEQDDLVAYCCYGTSARVNGGDYSVEALDLGLTVRPDLTGRGLGSSFAKAVIEHGIRTFSPEMLRVTIARFNKRAVRVWERNDFSLGTMFERPLDKRKFMMLLRRV